MATQQSETIKPPFDVAAVLGAFSFPVMVIGADDRIDYVNGAAEQFFEHGKNYLTGQTLDRVLPPDSPVLSVIAQVRAEGASISEYDVDMVLPRGGGRGLSVHAAPLVDDANSVVLSIHSHGAARNLLMLG